MLLVVSLAACAGGMDPANAPSMSGTVPSAKRTVEATIRIAIPNRRHRRGRVRGHYVSPATQSMAITMTRTGAAPVNLNVDLTPETNPNCTSTGPLNCSIRFALPPGSYAASFTTYDGLLSGGNAPQNPPTGNVLSANQTAAVTIAAGATNLLNVSLDGVPAGILITPAAGSTLSGDMNGYTAAQCGSPTAYTERLIVAGLDADGNVIVGSGAPVASIASSNTAVLAASTPSPGSPNAFTLTHPILTSTQAATLTVKVTPASDSGGSVVSASVPVTISGAPQPCVTITEYDLPNALSYPQNITPGPDGNMWFSETLGERVGKITPSGAIIEYPIGIHSNGITSAPDGNVWFTSPFNGYVGRMTTAGIATTYAIAGGSPYGIAVGTDQALWFADGDNHDIGRITTGGILSAFSTGLSSGAAPIGMTAGPDGNVWFTEATKDKIGRITTAGTITEFPGLPGSEPSGIGPGPDGNLWFTDDATGVGYITPAGSIVEFSTGLIAGSQPDAIAAGPDGALWFPGGSGHIGRITTSGSVYEYPLPNTGDGESGMSQGPDGSMWFVEQLGNRIGRIVISQ
jgi:streptogramin lyase